MKNLAIYGAFSYDEIMSALNELKKHLRPGQVYRRADLLPWSNAVDRHLKQLVEEGTLTKLSGGVYAYPKRSRFGTVPADDEKLVEAFLKDHRFLLTTPNAYNALGVPVAAGVLPGRRSWLAAALFPKPALTAEKPA